MITIPRVTIDDAHTFAQGLIANGWLNQDPDCVDSLFRQLVDITKLPVGYELAISVATPEMEQAGRATGVNAAWSYAKCYRNMLDAQLTSHVLEASKAVPARAPEVMLVWLASDVCTCPGAGDGSLRWPCPTHSPRQKTCSTRNCNQWRRDTRQALQQALDQCAAAAPQRNSDAD